MASHRYWRIANISAAGRGALELSEFQLLDGTTRVDAAATITSNIAPTSGALSSLKDNSLASVVAWASASGLSIDFDCGSAVEVNNFRMGAAGDAKRFPSSLSLQWSDDGTSYATMRQGDYYSWPGAFSWTRNVINPTRVRAWGALQSQSATGVLVLPYPSLLEPGDLLVAFTTSATVPATAPAGWAQLATTGPVSSGSGVYTTMWGKLAVESDRGGSFNGTNIHNGQVMSLTCGVRPPAVESSAGAFDSLNVNTRAIPVLTAAGPGRLGLSAAFWTLAFTSGNTDMTPPADPWIRHYIAQVQLRLGVASLNAMKLGDTTAGTWQTTATGTGGGWAVLAAIFAPADAAIESSPYAARGIPAVGYWPPPQPSPSQADMGKLRPVQVSKLRRQFAESIRGRGVGRISGSTKDKASPNIPVAERVMLFRQRDCAPIRETVSTPGTGAFSFDWIDETEIYFVVAFDHDRTFRAVIADALVPDLIQPSLARAPALFRGNGAMVIANGTSVALAAPAGAVVGDLLLATVFHRSAATPPAGWQLVASAGMYSPDGGTNNYWTDIYGKTAEASDLVGPTTFTQAASGAIIGQQVAAYSSAGTPEWQVSWYFNSAPAVDGSAGTAGMPTVQATGTMLYLHAAGFTYNGPSTTLSFTGAAATDFTRISTPTAAGNQLLLGYKQVFDGDIGGGGVLSNAALGTNMWGTVQLRIWGALLP